jgi:hypothetical protein
LYNGINESEKWYENGAEALVKSMTSNELRLQNLSIGFLDLGYHQRKTDGTYASDDFLIHLLSAGLQQNTSIQQLDLGAVVTEIQTLTDALLERSTPLKLRLEIDLQDYYADDTIIRFLQHERCMLTSLYLDFFGHDPHLISALFYAASGCLALQALHIRWAAIDEGMVSDIKKFILRAGHLWAFTMQNIHCANGASIEDLMPAFEENSSLMFAQIDLVCEEEPDEEPGPLILLRALGCPKMTRNVPSGMLFLPQFASETKRKKCRLRSNRFVNSFSVRSSTSDFPR